MSYLLKTGIEDLELAQNTVSTVHVATEPCRCHSSSPTSSFRWAPMHTEVSLLNCSCFVSRSCSLKDEARLFLRVARAVSWPRHAAHFSSLSNAGKESNGEGVVQSRSLLRHARCCIGDVEGTRYDAVLRNLSCRRPTAPWSNLCAACTLGDVFGRGFCYIDR